MPLRLGVARLVGACCLPLKVLQGLSLFLEDVSQGRTGAMLRHRLCRKPELSNKVCDSTALATVHWAHAIIMVAPFYAALLRHLGLHTSTAKCQVVARRPGRP